MQIKNNIKWVGINQMLKILIQVVGMIVLARIIEPKEYGVMSMALVVTVFASIFRDLGTSAAIIQKREIDHRLINSVFWLNIAMGVSIAIIVSMFSPLISHIFHEKRLILILCTISLSFPITSLGSVHLALLERDSKFNRVAFVEVFSSVLGLLFAIGLAYLGAGVYSLVAQALITALSSSVLLWIGHAWLPTLKSFLSKNEFKEVLSFSGNLTSFNVINYFSRNADNIIIGHMFSPSILGAYSLAYRIMLFPLQSLTFVASRALFPILSSKQDNIKEVREIYLGVITTISVLVCPIMCGMALLRVPFINLIVGEKWALTSELLLWLAPTGYIQSIVSTAGTIFMARNKTNILFLLGIVSAILQIGSFIIGAQFGVVSIARFYFFANAVNFLICMSVIMLMLNGNVISVFKVIYPSITASVLMTLFLLLMKNVSHFIDTYQLYMLPVLGCFFYFVYMFVFHRKQLLFIKGLRA